MLFNRYTRDLGCFLVYLLLSDRGWDSEVAEAFVMEALVRQVSRLILPPASPTLPVVKATMNNVSTDAISTTDLTTAASTSAATAITTAVTTTASTTTAITTAVTTSIPTTTSTIATSSMKTTSENPSLPFGTTIIATPETIPLTNKCPSPTPTNSSAALIDDSDVFGLFDGIRSNESKVDGISDSYIVINRKGDGGIDNNFGNNNVVTNEDVANNGDGIYIDNDYLTDTMVTETDTCSVMSLNNYSCHDFPLEDSSRRNSFCSLNESLHTPFNLSTQNNGDHSNLTIPNSATTLVTPTTLPPKSFVDIVKQGSVTSTNFSQSTNNNRQSSNFSINHPLHNNKTINHVVKQKIKMTGGEFYHAELACLENEEVSAYRLYTTFQATKLISLRLIMFQVFFLRFIARKVDDHFVVSDDKKIQKNSNHNNRYNNMDKMGTINEEKEEVNEYNEMNKAQQLQSQQQILKVYHSSLGQLTSAMRSGMKEEFDAIMKVKMFFRAIQ